MRRGKQYFEAHYKFWGKRVIVVVHYKDHIIAILQTRMDGNSPLLLDCGDTAQSATDDVALHKVKLLYILLKLLVKQPNLPFNEIVCDSSSLLRVSPRFWDPQLSQNFLAQVFRQFIQYTDVHIIDRERQVRSLSLGLA